MSTPRKRTDDRRKHKIATERQGRVQTVLKALGLWDRLRRTNLRKHFSRCYFPRVTVQLGENVQRTKETDTILKALDRVIEESTVALPLLGSQLRTADFLSFVWPVLELIHAAQSNDPGLAAFLREAKEKVKPLFEPRTIASAVSNLFRALDNELARFCRIDTRIYYLQIHYGWTESQKWSVRFTLHVEPPRVRTVAPEGKPRPAYWCGQPFGTVGVDWLEWPRALVGLPDGRPLPVFVQGHALDNLYRKEARALFIDEGEWLVHDYLWQSLRLPVIQPHPKQEGAFLVDYRLNMHKLGYLFVQPVNDVVLVRTFLFLTMDGTPEGNALWKRLRLRKEDKRQLELDKIHYFLMTDIQFDPQWVRIFEECGCGHLFRVLKEAPHDRCLTGYAEGLRTFLKSRVRLARGTIHRSPSEHDPAAEIARTNSSGMRRGRRLGWRHYD